MVMVPYERGVKMFLTLNKKTGFLFESTWFPLFEFGQDDEYYLDIYVGY